jgi:aspartyl/asparaginyl beta-hydroxylase (cupin superfamily)
MIGGSKAGGQEVKWTDGEIVVFDKGIIRYGDSETEIKETVSQAIKINETRIILNSVSHKGYIWNKN